MNKFIKIALLSLCFASNGFAAQLNGSVSIIGIVEPITGDIDISQNLMSVDDWSFLDIPAITEDVELLPPGSYTKAAGDVTVPAGHIGAHLKNVME